MRGYIYVLVNSSLPGLVKIGKTTRLPSTRVQELSANTGVPTPFIVAYERPFSDCDTAERYLHQQFADFRQTTNREFFRLTATEAIQAVEAVPDIADKGGGPDTVTPDPDRPKGFDLHAELISEATDYFLGANGRLQDTNKAVSILERAARSGSSQAHLLLGHVFQDGQLVPENSEKALTHFKCATDLGEFRAYPHAGRIYLQQAWQEAAAGTERNGVPVSKSTFANARRCAELFIDGYFHQAEAVQNENELDAGLIYILDTEEIAGHGPYMLPESVQLVVRSRATQLLGRIEADASELATSHPDLADRAMRWRAETKRWLRSG